MGYYYDLKIDISVSHTDEAECPEKEINMLEEFVSKWNENLFLVDKDWCEGITTMHTKHGIKSYIVNSILEDLLEINKTKMTTIYVMAIGEITTELNVNSVDVILHKMEHGEYKEIILEPMSGKSNTRN